MTVHFGSHPCLTGSVNGCKSLQARRQISQSLQAGKVKLQQEQPQEALELFKQVIACLHPSTA